jgi:replicative DNA helicase
MKIEDIMAKVLNEKPDVVFIDHLAILKSAQKFRSRYEEVSYLSAKIKEMARQFDVPVICMCQLNRALEGREIKAPTLSDIRDSGSVEQDGDIIGFIYRPEYHLLQQEPEDAQKHAEWEEKLNVVKGKAKFIIAKNRRGYTGSFVFGFRGETYNFYEL